MAACRELTESLEELDLNKDDSTKAEEEREAAKSLRREVKQRLREAVMPAKVKEAKDKAIATARLLWEASCKELEIPTPQEYPSSAVPSHSLATTSGHSFSEEEDLFCSYCGGQGGECNRCGRPNDFNQKVKKSEKKAQEKGHDVLKAKKSKIPLKFELEISDPRLTYLAEVKLGNLQLYGPGAVAAILSRSWAPHTASLIHTVYFHFIVFDSIAHLFGKMKTQFPNIKAISFECTCLESCDQLNALGEITDLRNLTIESEGNPIIQLSLWRMYAIYRLGPSIEIINGIKVTKMERKTAENNFGGLGIAASVLLPTYRVSSLLNSPRVKKILNEKGYSPKSIQSSQAAAEVMKATFTYDPDYDEHSLVGYKENPSKILKKYLDCVEESMKKRHLVQQHLLPTMLKEIVIEALEDFTDLDGYMKQSMQNFMKK